MEIHKSCESLVRILNRSKPLLAAIFLQFGFAGMGIISKVALNQRMSHYTLAVYRHAIATAVIAPFAITLERKVRPKMTLSIFAKIMLLGLLEPVLDQNLFYTGLKYTLATFASAMYNILPALTFVMACILGMEKVNIKKVRSQAKVVGTVVTVAGAMVMTLIKGPMIIEMAWTKGRDQHGSNSHTNHQDSIKGSLMITAGCFCWAFFVILQAITLRTYPAELSLTAWICLMGTLEGSVVTLAMNWGNTDTWSISFDEKIVAALYSGIVCSGIAYYIQGVVMKERGPIFLTAFSPLSMVIVAVLSFFILAEQMYLGRIIGAIVIVVGLYFVLWGKSKDHKPSVPSIDEQKTPVEQLMPVTGERKEYPNLDLVAINVRVIPVNESL